MTGEGNNNHGIDGKLDGRDGLTSEYQNASRELPPSHIDESILAASRKAVYSKPGWVIAPFSDHWRMPISIAAVLVLSVLVVFNLPDDATRMDYEQDFNTANDAALIFIESDELDNIAPAEMTVQSKQEALNDNEVLSPARPEPTATSFSDDPPLLMDLQRSIVPAVELESQSQQSAPATDIVIRAQRQVLESADSSASLTTEPEVNDFGNSSSEILLKGLVDDVEERVLSDTITTTIDDVMDKRTIVTNAEALYSQPLITNCTLPRPDFCAEIYLPVCGVRNTGIQCITTPCDSTENIEYANACSACSNEDVIGYIDGQCAN
ncbi:MAG: hypothetical protein ACI9XC_002216 [Gammaproteobacteria bacterium]|jgi:hypothetical protein